MSASSSTSISAENSGATLANWLFPLYVLLIIAGYFVLRLPAANVAGSEMTADRAMFSAVNAATLTGFQSTVSLDHYQPLAVATLLGLMFVGTLFTLIVGSLAVVRIAGLPFSTGQVVRGSIFYTAGACAIGTIALLPGRSPADALFLAVSSFGNCGLFTGALPGVTQWQAQLVLMPLAVAGGIGLPVIMEILWITPRTPRSGVNESGAAENGTGLSRHARTALAWYAGVYIITLVLLFAVKAAVNSGEGNFGQMVGTCSIAAVNSRSLGLPLISMSWLSRSMQWILMAAMMIGGAPASTAGGVKVTCVAELFRGVRRALQGEAPGRAFGIAALWVGLFTLLIAIALIVLLATNPDMPADRTLFDLVSAAGNVGLSVDTISMVGGGLYVLTMVMFLGRVGALLVVWWQADTAGNSSVAVA